ncbi:hypothetical protein E2C01_058299 [Portunus trituberculatus]|uniref:Uncharacterized protein n=1 Tax=Portunus trituberculatus TaxID=210409 RepID=A0A5B7H2L9_PORTR|nr:hypothetical protein [Portunus trituberculatus]
MLCRNIPDVALCHASSGHRPRAPGHRRRQAKSCRRSMDCWPRSIAPHKPRIYTHLPVTAVRPQRSMGQKAA